MSETMNFSEMIAEVPGIGQYVQAQTPHLLETRNLKAGYLGREVVTGANITVKRGEVVALLGPNGAGKSTTLLTIAGQLPPVDGIVMLSNVPTFTPMLLIIKNLVVFSSAPA